MTLSLTQDSFAELYARWVSFGATTRGGLDREAASQEHSAARHWLMDEMRALSLGTRVDPIGNIYGLTNWVADASYALVGSHSDSQPRGGRFDGSYGVLAGFFAVQQLVADVEAGRLTPTVNVGVVDWFNEEGSRFQPSLMGSKVATGRLPLETALDSTSVDRLVVRDELDAAGLLGHAALPPIAAYCEIHVEQGRTLEDEGVQIGLVTESWSVVKYRIRVVGEQAHIGTAVMRDRKDPLVGAAHIVLIANEVPDSFPEDTVIAAVGRFEIVPNSPGVIPAEVIMDVDIRAADEATLQAASELFEARLPQVHAGVTATSILSRDWRSSEYFPAGPIRLAEQVCRSLGLSSRKLPTRAGHDSLCMNRVTETLMMFVPSVDGISHSEREYTSMEDLWAGVQVLTDVLRRAVSAGSFAESPQ